MNENVINWNITKRLSKQNIYLKTEKENNFMRTEAIKEIENILFDTNKKVEEFYFSKFYLNEFIKDLSSKFYYILIYIIFKNMIY
jgi:hypothetical protein